jgi:hypothetical protein
VDAQIIRSKDIFLKLFCFHTVLKASHSWTGLSIPRSAGSADVPGHRRRADKRGDGRGEARRAHPRGHAGQAHGHAQQEDDHAGRLQVGDQLVIFDLMKSQQNDQTYFVKRLKKMYTDI